MVDTRTMLELLQAPTEGYRDAIVILAILAEDFELKVGLLQLVTSSQFHGFERDDPHAHIRWFNKITSMLKYKNVPSDAIKLMLFPFSLEGTAQTWLEKEPPRSIHTWEDLKFDETFSEAWDNFKDLLRKCPHHDFLKLHQIDTFYNALTQFDQDLLNAATGVVSKANSTTSSSSPSLDITALIDIVKELMLMNKANQQAFVKAIEETCGGPHSYYECLATDINTFNAFADTGTYNQGGNGYLRTTTIIGNQNQENNNYQAQNYQASNYQAQVGPSNGFSNYMKTNDVNLRAMQSQISNMKTKLKNEFKTTMLYQNNELKNLMSNEIKNMMSSFIQMQSPSGSGSLPSNTIANPRCDVKAITTRSGVAYDGPTIPPTPSPLPKEVERETKVTKDKPNTKPLIPYPSRLNDQKLREKTNSQMLKFLQIFQRLHFDLSFADALLHIPNGPLKKLPKKLGDPGRFLIPCDFQGFVSFMALADLAGIAEDVFVQVGKFTFLAEFIIIDYDVDPRVPPILVRPFLRTARALVDVHGEELILRNGDEKLIFHADSTSKHPHKHGNESINMINFIEITCEDHFLKTSDSLLDEFTDELALLDPFPSGNKDDNFDFEADLREIEYLLNQDPSTDSNIKTIGLILEKFTDKPAIDYSPLPGDDDDDLFDLKSHLGLLLCLHLPSEMRTRIAPDYEDSRARSFVHCLLELQSLTCLYIGI
uniref:Reverse transcriptase domain-containing protein n=1 Tax=Tanacetum cinerariifolium TaxID=118510 RepID=A0A699H5F1_TANCI|nr:hypothetical protein [Tanacetum cinerariifolium]